MYVNYMKINKMKECKKKGDQYLFIKTTESS